MTTITISREPASGWNGAALLGWYALRDALAKSGSDNSAAGEPAEQ